jgi:hypothetical protein
MAVLLVGDPGALFADVTASLVGNSGLQPGTEQSTPEIQSTADAQDLPLTVKEAPARDEIATSEPGGQDGTEKNEPPPEALFRQFQAWAAEKDAQADVGSVQPVQDSPAQVVQDAPTKVAENARAPLRLMQKRRHVQPVQNARAEMRMQNSRRKIRREQNTQDARAQNTRRVEAPPAPDTRAQDQSLQTAQPPSFLQTFGLRQ